MALSPAGPRNFTSMLEPLRYTRTASVPSRISMPSSRRILHTSSATSGSSRLRSCFPCCTTVTALPNRRNIWANSKPTSPPPKTSKCPGSSCNSRIEAESNVFTASSPMMPGRAGRSPVLMKILSPVCPGAAGIQLHLDDSATGEVCSAKNEIDVPDTLHTPLLPIAECVHDRLLAPVNLLKVNTHSSAVNAVVGRAPREISDPRASHHRLCWRAAHIDACAADMLTLD